MSLAYFGPGLVAERREGVSGGAVWDSWRPAQAPSQQSWVVARSVCVGLDDGMLRGDETILPVSKHLDWSVTDGAEILVVVRKLIMTSTVDCELATIRDGGQSQCATFAGAILRADI